MTAALGSDRHTVLVTGAGGFVGRALAIHLLELGFMVRGTRRRTDPLAENLSAVDWLAVEDMNEDTKWDTALAGVNYVVHLAGLAHQIGSLGVGRAAEFNRVNALATRRLAEECRRSSMLRRFVYMSSVSAIASSSGGRVTEASEGLPDTDYGRSKLAGEMAVRETLRDSQDWCILRPALVYGPESPGNVQRLLNLLNYGLPLPFRGIRNCRSFTYVGNLVDLVARVLTHPAASRRTYLVSDGQDVSTPGLVGLIASAAGRRTSLFSVPAPLLRLVGRLGDGIEYVSGFAPGIDSYSIERLIGSLSVDSALVRRELNWHPPYSLEEGLRRTLSDQRLGSKTRP